MRRIAILNQKGGVGKTTTTVNLAAGLAAEGKRVAVIDLDPQAHATTHLGVEPNGESPSMYDALTRNQPLSEIRREIKPGLWMMGSDINLSAAEVELAGVVGREVILRDLLEQHLSTMENKYDYVLMDCAPSLGVLSLNALAAAEEVFIPLQPHYLALHGLSKLLETTALVARRINPVLKVTGIVVCMYESNTRLCGEVIRDLEAFLEKGRTQNTPWAYASVFSTRIRRNIKLAECPSFGQSILDYAPNCPGAIDYTALAEEIMKQETECGLERITMQENRLSEVIAEIS